jgi:hypothetical protein
MTLEALLLRCTRLLGLKTIAIGDGQRGLLYRDRRAVRVLMPGVTRLIGHHAPLDLRLCRVDASPLYAGADAEQLIEAAEPAVVEAFTLIEAGADEVLLLTVDGRLVEALPPRARRLCWKRATAPVVQRLALRDALQVPANLLADLQAIGRLDTRVSCFEVPDGATGRVFADGRLIGELGPGRHGYWRSARKLGFRVVGARRPQAERPATAARRQAA